MKRRGKEYLFGSLRVLSAAAFLAALSIILGKYLAIPGGDVLRFSFENMPIMFAGMSFGPLVGVAVGLCADLIGCILVGYAVNPLVTLGAVIIGAVSGGVYILLKKSRLHGYLKASISVCIAHILGSLLIKTFGLSAFYSMPLGVLMLWRLLNYAIIAPIECVILSYLLENKALSRTIARLLPKEKE